ncbi:lysozyme [Brevundimonas sp. NPDC092305]|uniref:lysozyme n=1 Tax=Brevundimonas sp. NPDC092305 TaxID=3363957 RepID=UPI0037FCDC0F
MSDTPKPRLKISREGIVLIKSFEGFRPHAVRSNGGWAIGYGHTASARAGATVTEDEAELLLRYDLMPVEKALNALPVALNQPQFDALASFALSVGVERFMASDAARHLQSGAASGVGEALMLLPAQPRIDGGLQRRAAERALFDSDPARPATLAELLSAPIALFPATPAAATDARAAALAALLGENQPAPFPSAEEPDAPALSPADAALAAEPAFVVTEPEPAPVEPTPPPAPQPTASEPIAEQPVLRHEAPTDAPSRFDWSEAGLYVFMCVIGLIACAFAAAAFRWSLLQPQSNGDPAVIASALAITGAMCVGVSAWNLYVHWRSRG